MKVFKKQKIIFLITFLISFSLHSLLIIMNYKTLSKIILENLTAPSRIPLVVDLEQTKDTAKIQNVNIFSKNNQKGVGQITPPLNAPLNLQHLLGQTYQIVIQNQRNSKKVKANFLKKTKPSQVRKSKKKEEILKKEKKIKASETFKLEDSSIENQKIINTGIESVNSFTMQFNFDNSNLKKIGINAHLESDFVNNLGKIFSKQLKAYFVDHPQNFFFLSGDKVSVLATVDRDGEIAFVDYLEQSKSQTYMNYLIKKMVDNPEKLAALPTLLKKGNKEYIHLTVQISYSGPPLYHITYTIGQ